LIVIFAFLLNSCLGLILQGGWDRFVNIRMFGVLQRLGACYFFSAVLVLIFDDDEDEEWEAGICFEFLSKKDRF